MSESSELTIYDAGISSLKDIKDLHTKTHLKAINLHRNRIRTIERLDTLVHLTVLDLSSNEITRIMGLEGLVSLKVLNLSANKITTIEGLENLYALKRLMLAYNGITTLEGLTLLHGVDYQLESIDLTGNLITALDQLQYVSGCINLQHLHLQQQGGKHANPVCTLSKYKQAALTCAKQLAVLDHEKVHFEIDRAAEPSISLEYPALSTYLQAIKQSHPTIDVEVEAEVRVSQGQGKGSPQPKMIVSTPCIDEYLSKLRNQGKPRVAAPRQTQHAIDEFQDAQCWEQRAGNLHGEGTEGLMAKPRAYPAQQQWGQLAVNHSPGLVDYQTEQPRFIQEYSDPYLTEVSKRKATERSLEACMDKLQQQQQQLLESAEQVTRLGSEKAQLQRQCADAQEELQKAKLQQARDLSQVTDELQEVKKEAIAHVKQAKDMEAQLRDQNKTLQDQLVEETSKSKSLEHELDLAREHLETFRRRLASWEEADEAKRKKASESREAQSQMLDQVDEIKSHMKLQTEEHQKAILVLEEKMAHMEGHVLEKTREKEALDQQLMDSKKMVDKSKEENDSLRQTIIVLKQELARMFEDCKAMKKEVQDKTVDCQKVEKEYKDLLSQQQHSLRDQLAKAEEERATLSKDQTMQREQLLQAMQEEKAKNQRLTIEVQDVTLELQALQRKQENHDAIAKEKQRALDKSVASSSKHKLEAQQLQVIVKHQEERLRDLTQKCHELRMEKEDAIKRYHEEDDVSWQKNAEIARLEGRLITSQKRILRAEEELKSAESEKGEWQHKAEHLEVLRSTTASELETARLESKAQMDCIHALKTELTQLKKTRDISTLEDQATQLAFYEGKAKELSASIAEVKTQLSRKSNALEEVQEQLIASNESIRKLKQVANEKVREVNALEDAASKHNDEFQQLKRETGNLKSTIQEKDRLLQEQDQELAHQDRAIQDLTERNDRKRADLESMKSKEKEHHTKLAEIEEEWALKLTQASTKLDDAKQQISRQTLDLKYLQEKVAASSKSVTEADDLRDTLTQRESELKRMLSGYSQQKQLIQKYEQDIHRMQMQIQQLELDKRELTHMVGEYEKKLHHQKKYLKRMMGDFEQ